MSAIVAARGLGKQYRRRWALRDCTLEIPAGRVTGRAHQGDGVGERGDIGEGQELQGDRRAHAGEGVTRPVEGLGIRVQVVGGVGDRRTDLDVMRAQRLRRFEE